MFLLVIVMVAAVICGCGKNKDPKETEPAVTTEKVVTTAPKQIEPPVVTTEAPVVTTAKPVVTTAEQPPVTTAKPVVTQSQPVVTTAKPVVTTAKPSTPSTPTTDKVYFPTVVTTVAPATTAPVVTDQPVEPTVPTLTLGELSAKPGDLCVFALNFTCNPGISFLSITPVFDADVFEWEGTENGDIFEAPEVALNIVFSADADVTANGCLAMLKLRVKDNAPAGEYSVAFTVNECYNAEYEPVAIEVVAGKATIAPETTAPVTTEAPATTAPVTTEAPVTSAPVEVSYMIPYKA